MLSAAQQKSFIPGLPLPVDEHVQPFCARNVIEPPEATIGESIRDLLLARLLRIQAIEEPMAATAKTAAAMVAIRNFCSIVIEPQFLKRKNAVVESRTSGRLA
jgi:hypothetical protein